MRKKIHLIIKELFGENVALSFPVPCVENGLKTERYFIYRMSFDVMKTRPFAVISILMSDGTILAYRDCRIQDYMDTQSYPFSEKIYYTIPDDSISAVGLKRAMAEFDELYQQIREFAFRETLSDAEKEAIGKYQAMFDQLVPAALIPYYHGLNEAFFHWINKARE